MTAFDAPLAVFSPDQQYRYFLSRNISASKSAVAFIGLNPSTADATANDPTIRRCIAFAREWGYGSLWMVNLFALRSTDPAGLMAVTDPVGPDNDAWLNRAARHADLVVAAWGNKGTLLDRAAKIVARHGDLLHAIAITKTGMPGHPLYIKGGTKPRRLIGNPDMLR